MAATLQDRIEAAFAGRAMPAEVVDASVTQFDSDVDEALWFAGREWRELRWKDWLDHSSALLFFSREAFAYYLPSLLLHSARNTSDWSYAVDSLIGELERHGVRELVRTGLIAIGRGGSAITEEEQEELRPGTGRAA